MSVDQNTNLWYLQNIDVTGIFCKDKMMEHDDRHVEQVFAKGKYIYLPEDDSDKIYFILRGRVKIGTFGEGGNEILKAVLGRGEVFGELALVKDGERGDFAQSMEETELCIIHRKDLDMMFKDRSSIQIFFLKLFGNRILEMENRLESLVFKDSRTRIINYLLELAAKRGERVGYEVVVRKFLTHKEIANLTATSRQTVTTVLNEMRNKEIIKFDRRRLLIRDKERLQQEAQN